MGKHKKTDKRKKSGNSPDNISDGTKQRKMATPKQGQKTPQASQFSYMGMPQPGFSINPQAYTMNVNGMSMSPPLYSQPQGQQLPDGDILNNILSRLECIDTKLVRLDTI